MKAHTENYYENKKKKLCKQLDESHVRLTRIVKIYENGLITSDESFERLTDEMEIIRKITKEIHKCENELQKFQNEKYYYFSENCWIPKTMKLVSR